MKKYLKYLRILAVLATQLVIGLAAAQSNYFPQLAAIISTEGWPEDVSIGDVTGDGIADIVLINNGYVNAANNNRVVVFRMGENGAFRAPLTFEYTQVIGQDRSLQLLNVDDDDALEIVAGVGNNLVVANYNAAAVFDLQILKTFTRNDRLAAIDINLDGQQDLVAVQNTGQRMAVMYLTDGNGSLHVYDSLDLSSRGDQFEVDVADVNADGRDDFLLMHGGSAPFSTHLWVYPHDGIGGFKTPDSYALGGAFDFVIVKQLTAGDFNQDGLTDVLLSQSNGDSFLLAQNGAGKLDPYVELSLDNRLVDLESVDVDGNGETDVLSLHEGSMLRPAALALSFQVSGQLSTPDLTFLPKSLAFDPQSMAVGDINSDGCDDVVIADALQGLVVYQGRNCLSYADLQLTARKRGYTSFTVQLSNLESSESVAEGDAYVYIVIEATYHPLEEPNVIIIDEKSIPAGCDLSRLNRSAYEFECEPRSLSMGDAVNWYFRYQTIDHTYEDYIQVTGRIEAAAVDPNPDNNDIRLYMGME